MRQTEIENKFIEIEKRLTLLESMFDLKPVEIGKKYEEPKIIPFSQQEEKKDSSDSPNENYLGPQSSTEEDNKLGQMSVSADNHPLAVDSPQVVTHTETRKVLDEENEDNSLRVGSETVSHGEESNALQKESNQTETLSVDNIKKKGRPKKVKNDEE